MLLVDVSGSLDFGTVKQMKKDMVTEIAATLAFSAMQNNDKIGVIFFSDRIEKFIPPKKGRKHILYIIRELIDFQPESKKTDIGIGLQYLTNVMKRRCTAFILSDFIDRKHIKVDTYKKYDRILEVPFVQSCFMLPTEVAKKQKYYEGYVGTCNREETDYQMQVCLNYGFNILLDNESLSLDLPRTMSSGGIRSVKNYKRHFLEVYNEYQFWKRNKEYLKLITNINPNPFIRALAFMMSKIFR